MPGWQPNWQDVRFDHARADAAVRACEEAAAVLDGVAGSLPGVAAGAAAGWQGLTAQAFAEHHPARGRSVVGTAGELRRLARAIASAAADARAEQAHRVRERERWRQDKAAADARRREAELARRLGEAR